LDTAARAEHESEDDVEREAVEDGPPDEPRVAEQGVPVAREGPRACVGPDEVPPLEEAGHVTSQARPDTDGREAADVDLLEVDDVEIGQRGAPGLPTVRLTRHATLPTARRRSDRSAPVPPRCGSWRSV